MSNEINVEVLHTNLINLLNRPVEKDGLAFLKKLINYDEASRFKNLLILTARLQQIKDLKSDECTSLLLQIKSFVEYHIDADQIYIEAGGAKTYKELLDNFALSSAHGINSSRVVSKTKRFNKPVKLNTPLKVGSRSITDFLQMSLDDFSITHCEA